MLSTMCNWMSGFDSAEVSETGILTSPKAMDPFQIERAMMWWVVGSGVAPRVTDEYARDLDGGGIHEGRVFGEFLSDGNGEQIGEMNDEGRHLFDRTTREDGADIVSGRES